MTIPSTGPYNYNRFSHIDELQQRERQYFMEQKKKLDAVGEEDADIDNDGDVDKSDSYLHKRRKAIGKAMGKDDKKEVKENRQTAYTAGESDAKKSMKSRPAKITGGKTYTMMGKDGKPLFKESKCGDGCDCDDCKKAKKKKMYEWIEALVQEGYDLSEYNMEQMEELYDQALLEASEETTEVVEEVTIEEAICQYLMDNGFANNPVSAEVVFANMSEGWRNDVANEIFEAYQTMSPKATEMSKRRSASLSDKEHKAAGMKNNEAQTNKLMHQKRKVMDARSRHGAPGMR